MKLPVEIEGASDVASDVFVQIMANLLVLVLARPTSSKLEDGVVKVVPVVAVNATDCRVISLMDSLTEADAKL